MIEFVGSVSGAGFLWMFHRVVEASWSENCHSIGERTAFRVSWSQSPSRAAVQSETGQRFHVHVTHPVAEAPVGRLTPRPQKTPPAAKRCPDAPPPCVDGPAGRVRQVWCLVGEKASPLWRLRPGGAFTTPKTEGTLGATVQILDATRCCSRRSR